MNWQTIAQNHDLNISTINLSEIEGAFRLDADYYQQKFYNIITKIKSKKYDTLSNLVSNKTKKFDKKESGYFNYLEISNINTTTGGYKFELLPIEEAPSRAQKKLNKNDVVISTVRPNRNAVAIIEDEKDKMIASSGFCVLKSKNINPYFLFTFFKTKPIIDLLIRKTTATMYPAVSEQDILNLPIPLPSSFFEKEIEKIIKNVKDFQEKAELEYQEAEQSFIKEINLDGYITKDNNISIRNLKECLNDNRFDAEYWQPKYDEIENKVSFIKQEKLEDMVSIKKGVETGSEAYSEEGNLFFRVSDFSIYGFDEGEKRISEELYEKLKKNFKPLKEEILFTKDGTIGISFALHEDVDAIISSAFLRLKPKTKINNDYLALALNSSYCKAQIERMSGGAIIAHLKPDNVIKIKIPILTDEKQENIAHKVSNAFRLRNEAKNMLEKAKKTVELFIEQDEEEALKYLKS